MPSENSVTMVLSSKHLAMIRQFAKDSGYPSASSAIRRIIDEWAMLKAKESQLDHLLADRATCAPYSD